MSQEGNNLQLGFEVRDTGIGIPADRIDRLFQAFTQVDSSTTRKYGGTSLGLVISKRLGELMGGSIYVESELGKGTSFHFTIVTQPCTGIMLNNIHTSMMDLKNKRILIVDDNHTNLYILKGILENWKLDPATSISAGNAINMLEKESFDMVITDMQMPDMDGMQLAAYIKEYYPHLPVILLSSWGDNRSKKNPHLFNSVLAKPIKQRELYKAVINCLGGMEPAPVQKENESKAATTTDFALSYPLDILIAEDHMVNQTLITMVMNKLGYAVAMVENRIQALEALNEKQYDVVLMDVQMPEMDGLEATRLIRTQLHYQPVIIALTANAMHADKEKCFSTGMDDYLSKPIELEKLMSLLAQWGEKINAMKVAL